MVMVTASPPDLPVDRLRRLDYWLGVPICFLLTLCFRISSAFAKTSRPAGEPRNVLFIELAEMGSMVLACPAVQRLRSAHPQAVVFFLVFKHIADSVRVLELVPDDQVLTIDASSFGALLRDSFRFIRDARRLRIDTTINLEVFTRFSTILACLSGAGRRVGFYAFSERGQYTGDLVTHKVTYSPHVHTWQSFLTLVKAVDDAGTDLPMGRCPTELLDPSAIPRLHSDLASRQRLLQRLARQSPAITGKRLIVVNPNASSFLTVRKWPLERYAELVARLVSDPRNACVLTGLASERADARFILDRVKSDRVVDFTGQTSLKELLDLYSLAPVLVTNDSGPAHFAALTDVHVVVFFGPETPALYKPLTDRCTVMYSHHACSPCVSAFNQRRTTCTDNRCLQVIQVDTVYETLTQLLADEADTAPPQTQNRLVTSLRVVS
jgi:ADP-heptose:LPS heptosyltransferase